MQINATALPAHLSKPLKALYTLHGDEALLVQEAADAIRAAARAQGYTERVVHTVAGAHFDWSEVLAAGGSMSLFGDKQLLEIRIPSGKPGKEGSSALQKIAEQAAGNDGLLTLVILPKLDKMSKTSAWFGALDSYGVTIELFEIERRALATWLADRLAKVGITLRSGAGGTESERTLKFFADRVEGNLLAAHQEVQKLALLYPASAENKIELSFEQVEAAVLNVARYDVFKLSEAVLAGNLARTQKMLDGLEAEGEAAVLVHWALSEDIRNLHRLRSLMDEGKPLPMALQEARVWGAKQRLYERILPHLSAQNSAALLHAAREVDGIVKGLHAPGWPQNPWTALQRLAAMLCQIAK